MYLNKLKKQSVLQLAALFLTAVFVIVVGACPSNDIFVVDRSALDAKITEAERATVGIEVNTAHENVALGSYWVHQAAVDALAVAINTARRAGKTTKQAEIDIAESTLDNAITIFNNARQEGSKVSGFTLEQLIERIVQAKAAKESASTSTDGADVNPGNLWVSSTVMTAFETAISAAEVIRDASPDQTTIDSTIITLANAITTFNNARRPGTKTELNIAALIAKIDEANAAKIGIVIDTAAANVATGTYWVTQAVMDTFNTAIATAQTALGATTQAAVDSAVTVLNTAITTFNNAKTNGAKATIDYGTTLSWGTTVYTPGTLCLTPGNTTTELNLNWLTSGVTAVGSNIASVRFIEGTLNAGIALIEKTGTVATASSASSIYHAVTVTGLKPGKSYQYSVSRDGTNWSPMYDYKVPADTGTWKFAVMSDAQITLGNVDSNSRYPSSTTTTAASWAETMTKIAAANVSFIVSCGDQVDEISTSNTVVSQYGSFFTPPQLKNLPLAPVIGNHDTATHVRYYYNMPNDPNARSQTVNDIGNYYYLYNNILFVGLNTGSFGPTSRSAATPYITKFETTIKNAKTAHAGKYDWLIVQHHKSTASVAEHLADADIQYYVEAGFERVMSEQNVDFVLAGHDHVYARSYPLAGKDQGKVSVPNKTFPAASGSTWNNTGNPVYFTFSTASGLKYYKVSSDTAFAYNGELYNKSNAVYPYLGDSTAGDGSTYFGSNEYMNNKRLPVSNAAFVQPFIPSYTIVEVSNNPTGTKSITFKTYPIATKAGTNQGATTSYSFNENTPFDTITVTK